MFEKILYPTDFSDVVPIGNRLDQLGALAGAQGSNRRASGQRALPDIDVGADTLAGCDLLARGGQNGNQKKEHDGWY